MKNQQYCECFRPSPPCCDRPQPCPPSPPEHRAVFLLERVLAYGCLESCQNLTICLDDPCGPQISSIERIEHECCIQRCDVCHPQCIEAWERQEIPVTLHVKDTCGNMQCVRGCLLLRIPLRVLECDCCTGMIQSRLLLRLCSVCLIRQCGNSLEIRADIAAQLYLTCPQTQAFSMPAPPPRCTFPPLYPQPCTHKKAPHFAG